MHLYVHVPFCARRCSYCDFAIAVRKRVPARAYVDAVLKEWAERRRDGGAEGDLDTLYLGGGTPSLLDPVELTRLIEGLTRDSALVPGAEVTIEVNPDDVSAERARAWRAAGITRASLGVQSFDPAVLTWMHRTHRAEQVAPAVATLREAGIADLSLDLIFALPAELSRDWSRDLETALALEPDHLSLYGLTVEEHTPLARWVERREVRRTDDDRYAEEFLVADRRLGAAGYEHYEVSNYARPGHRARHNSAYWRRATYVGLGPSAHSGSGRGRSWNVRDWAEYERLVKEGKSPVAGNEALDDEALRLEELYLGLRTADGVPVERVPALVREQWVREGWATVWAHDSSPPDPLSTYVERGGELDRRSPLHERGEGTGVRIDTSDPSPPSPLSTVVERGSGSRLRLTAEGWLRLDALVGGSV
ncbi:MAG TPA: radical SAM family heme chaperone HemW [Gemmatimonadales bacterium]|nr:radical SAM family heme chaperone HemW [Gemmatimonadales bacterium]